MALWKNKFMTTVKLKLLDKDPNNIWAEKIREQFWAWAAKKLNTRDFIVEVGHLSPLMNPGFDHALVFTWHKALVWEDFKKFINASKDEKELKSNGSFVIKNWKYSGAERVN